MLFDPKPYFADNGVCFTSKKLSAGTGLAMDYDAVTIKTNERSNVSSGK